MPLLGAAALVQTTTLARLSLLGGRPDLVFLLVAGWAFLRGPTEGVVWAFIGGVFLDLVSGGPFGAITLSLLVVALFVGRQWGRELGSVLLQLVLLALVASFLGQVLMIFALNWTGYPVGWLYALPRVAAPTAILNALLAPFAHWLLSWLDRKTRPEGLTFDGD